MFGNCWTKGESVSTIFLSSAARVVLFVLLVPPGDAVEALKLADEALAKGDYDAAINQYDKAIQLDPKFARPYHGRGVALFHKGQYDKGIASYTEAIRLEPQNDVAVFDRGLAYWEKGEPKQALTDFQLAIRLNPKNDSAYNGLAWGMATAPQPVLRDGKKAIEFATKACELTEWRNPFHLSTLAAAYAELGNFERAIEWHKKAMASPDFPPSKLDRARERLKLYEQGKPYREDKGKK
jgi:tetratricopeptide (TPR) repeat protein